ncbi:MAG: LptF/LptG family permease [Planctomycetaceae bacterium]|nr:LptF/LptG family permease [Planctomycetaceae bacterium]
MRPFLPLLHRYVFSELLKVFLLVLTVLTVLTMFVGVFQEATERGLGPRQLIQVLPYIIPNMLPFTIPATLLMTVSVVYGRIAGDQEITASKAAGINVVSLMGPAFFLGAVMSVCTLLLTDQVIPWAMANIQRTVIAAVEEIFLDKLKTESRLRYKPKGIDITVREVQGHKLIDVVFRKRDSRGNYFTVQAREAHIEFDHDRGIAIVHMTDAVVETPSGGGNRFPFQLTQRGENQFEFPLPLDNGQKKPMYLSLRKIDQELNEIEEHRRELEERQAVEAAMSLTLGAFDRMSSPGFASGTELAVGKARRDRLRTEYHSRFALACSCFFFVLLGSPFAIMHAKSQFLTSFLYCFGPIVGVYYPLVLGLITQAKRGHMDPAWATWVGNALILVAALVVIRRVTRY